ncbi:hypothetical protein GW17_00010049 [Ensete ventricosum]|nr:hypothetical protein GW17_00010049 [Ensete ventricosum]
MRLRPSPPLLSLASVAWRGRRRPRRGFLSSLAWNDGTHIRGTDPAIFSSTAGKSRTKSWILRIEHGNFEFSVKKLTHLAASTGKI